jgi:hypothetical protein
MLISQRIQITASSNGRNRPISGSVVEVGSQGISRDQWIPANSQGLELPVSFTVADLVSLVVWSDKGCTVNFEGPGGDYLMVITPGFMFFHALSTMGPFPFPGDVERVKVSNGPTCRLRIEGVCR